jgi:CheY-like chemotaxis protein
MTGTTSAPLVMIVDDDFDVCEVYADALVEIGLEVAIARNGRDALALLERQPVRPALILVDLMMPVMDGRALIAALRARPSLAVIPIVVMTANRGGPPVEGAPCLFKPFSLEVLCDTVQANLVQHADAPRAAERRR